MQSMGHMPHGLVLGDSPVSRKSPPQESIRGNKERCLVRSQSETAVPNPALLLANQVNLGESDFFVPQFPRLYNKDTDANTITLLGACGSWKLK